jgi:PEP-CTERM motif
MLRLRKHLLPVTAAAVLAMGLATPTLAAAPTFQVSPNNLALCVTPVVGCAPFTANFIQGSSSELLTILNATQVSGEGFANFTGFVLNGNALNGGVTGLNVDYGLYITFTLTDTLTGGSMGAPGSSYNLTSLDFQVFADPFDNNTYTQASVSPLTPATVNVNGVDILLGSGHLISGVAGFDAQGGAFLNSTETYQNTANGNLFFTQPIPFFTLAFTEFNNTLQGVSTDGTHIAITDASGGADFNRVPEPASLALIGLGLLAAGAAYRRRNT